MNRFHSPASAQKHENHVLVVMLGWLIAAGVFVVLGNVMAAGVS